MHRNLRGVFSFVAALVFGLTAAGRATAADESRLRATNRSGELRVEQRSEEYWIISSKDSAQATQIPLESGEQNAPVEFYFSPNDEWLFTLPNGGSCLRAGSLFHRDAVAGTVEAIESFNDQAWAQGWKLVGFTENFSAQGACAMMRFIGWSQDSTRLLVGLRGGQGKFEMDGAYLYFHTGMKRWEVTPYLRKLNKITSDILSATDDVLPCAESAAALPGEAELKGRLEKLDAELNARYAELMKAASEKDLLRREQQGWLKQRNAGLKFYLSLAKPAEKERRRLEFLGDVTAMRLAMPPEKWSTGGDWLY